MNFKFLFHLVFIKKEIKMTEKFLTRNELEKLLYEKLKIYLKTQHARCPNNQELKMKTIIVFQMTLKYIFINAVVYSCS